MRNCASGNPEIGDPPVLTFDRANDIWLRWARKRAGEAVGLPLGLSLHRRAAMSAQI